MSGKINENSIINYSVSYNYITEESAKIGDFAGNDWEEENKTVEGIDGLESLNDNYGFIQESNTGKLQSGDWFISDKHEKCEINNEGKEEWRNYYYNLHIKSIDGKEPTSAQLEQIAVIFGIREQKG